MARTSFVVITLVLVWEARALAQEEATRIVVERWDGCSARLEGGRARIECADSEGDEHPGRSLACAPLVGGPLVRSEQMDVVYGCGGDVPNALVLVAGDRIVWALGGDWYEGLHPDVIDLVASPGADGREQGLRELIVRSAAEEGSYLTIFHWAGGRMHTALVVSLGGGTEEPEVERRATLDVGSATPTVEVTRVRGRGPARERFVWRPEQCRFEIARRAARSTASAR